MLRYALARLILALPTFLLSMSIIFFAIRLVPGDQLTQFIGEQVISASDRRQLKHQLGFDEPLPMQYSHFVLGIIHADFGHGTFDKQPVREKITARLSVTVELALFAASISIILAIPIGIMSALARNSIADYVLRLVALLALSIPSFWLGTVSLVALAIYFHWTPSISPTSLIHSPLANLRQFFLPSLILGAVLSGSLMRITRSMMLEVLSEDYIRTAWAKGLAGRMVVFRHALRNTFIPVITVIGLQVAALLGGTIVIESIFGLPGLGTLFTSSLTRRDYPVIQGINAFVVIVVILINLAIDMSYPCIDPRVIDSYG